MYLILVIYYLIKKSSYLVRLDGSDFILINKKKNKKKTKHLTHIYFPQILQASSYSSFLLYSLN